MSLVARLRGRTPAELIDRTRQWLARSLELCAIGDLQEPDAGRVAELVDMAQVDAAPAIRGPFFVSVEQGDATRRALQRTDNGFSSLRQRADRILAGRYDLLGHCDLDLGLPPDWWADPVSGVRAPARHWSRIDFLDPKVVGDHKAVWELSRHQHLVTLGQAWWCTGEARYLDAVTLLLTDWLERNPPKTGPHWASSLELAFRAMAWLWVLALAGDDLPVALRRRMFGVLAIMGLHIEQFLSTWFSPNTHLTGEALGLFMLGTMLPQLRDAERFRRRGAAILLDWVGRHVRPDGTYVEQSTWYHRYTTDFYLQFLLLAERSGLRVRDRIGAPVLGLLSHLSCISRPDGSMPLIGDDDGGRLLFLDERTAHDVRTPLALGSVLFDRGDFAALAGPATSELVWLLGPDGLDRFERLDRRAPAHRHAAFPDGGTYVMRSGWGDDASVLTIAAGPHGFRNGGHAHADALSIDWFVGGRSVLVDPGTFTYTAPAAWRDRFRETASHCAATVDGCGSAVPAGPFQWARRADSQCVAWHDAGDTVLFAGTHNGYAWLQPRVDYRRVIAFVAPDLWIIRDELLGDGEHELAVHWQCAPGVTARVRSPVVSLMLDGNEVAVMQVVGPHGEWTTEDSFVSPTYGVREPALHLRHVRRHAGPMCITTVVTTGAPLRSVAEGEGAGMLRPVEVTWGGRRGMLATFNGAPSWLDSDAAVTWIERRAAGSPLVVAATSCTRLIVSGRELEASGTATSGVLHELDIDALLLNRKDD